MLLAASARAMGLAHPRVKTKKGDQLADSTFRNPFSIRPARKFGVGFTIVLLVTRVAKHYAGYNGQMVVSAISGLVDVDAISLTLAGFGSGGTSAGRGAVVGLTLGGAGTASFK